MSKTLSVLHYSLFVLSVDHFNYTCISTICDVAVTDWRTLTPATRHPSAMLYGLHSKVWHTRVPFSVFSDSLDLLDLIVSFSTKTDVYLHLASWRSVRFLCCFCLNWTIKQKQIAVALVCYGHKIFFCIQMTTTKQGPWCLQ